MHIIKPSSLEKLLVFAGNPNPNSIVSDASVLTCGCLVSESLFVSSFKDNCPNCKKTSVSLLSEITPLRELYVLLKQRNPQTQTQSSQNRSGRPSSKKSIKASVDTNSVNYEPAKNENMDLINLFYKFAKEEEGALESGDLSENAMVKPIKIASKESKRAYSNSNSPVFTSQYSNNNSHKTSIIDNEKLKFEKNLLKSLSEEKEYNFSKCFPLYRKLSTYPSQQSKFNLSFKSGSMLKKNARFVNSCIHTYYDYDLNIEITRYALITEKRWELYEYSPSQQNDSSSSRPQLICCGKVTGEYGENFNNMRSNEEGNIIVKYDFNQNSSTSTESNSEFLKRKLLQWEHFYCKLTSNYLIISGTKGLIRIFNVSKTKPYDLGQPIYSYLTNFPIRCVSISPNEALVACGITAKERISGQEQPFIILHKLSTSNDLKLQSVDPITITIPYRDPIKLINFNSTSTHLVCCTAWESRYLVIKLRSYDNSENYRKPRLIWSDSKYARTSRRDYDEADDSLNADNDMTMANEGITDLQFGTSNSNTLILASCSLKNRPPLAIKLHGTFIDSKKRRTSDSDNFSTQSSYNSVDEEEISNITSSEISMKFPEVGSLIHKFAISPRGDGILFLNKNGNLYLVSTSDFQSHSANFTKKIIVLLGETSNAERFNESASIKFSSDGGQIFVVDRKGIFSVFDFTKGVPGESLDVVKCKIINS